MSADRELRQYRCMVERDCSAESPLDAALQMEAYLLRTTKHYRLIVEVKEHNTDNWRRYDLEDEVS